MDEVGEIQRVSFFEETIRHRPKEQTLDLKS